MENDKNVHAEEQTPVKHIALKVIGWFVVIIAIIVVISVVVTKIFIDPWVTQNKANEFAAAGDYASAVRVIEPIKDKNAETRATYDEYSLKAAQSFMEKEEYDSALDFATYAANSENEEIAKEAKKIQDEITAKKKEKKENPQNDERVQTAK